MLDLARFALYTVSVGPGPEYGDTPRYVEYWSTIQGIVVTRIFLDILLCAFLLIFATGVRHLVRQAQPDYEWMGALAYRGDWFSKLTPKVAKFWSLGALLSCLVVVGIAIPVLLGGVGRSGNDPGTMVAGGVHWLAFIWAMWEPFVLVGVGIGLLVLFGERLKRQGQLAREASAGAYTVYLIHPLVLVPFCYAFTAVALYPLLKFVVAVAITLPLCFLVSSCARRIPLLNKAL